METTEQIEQQLLKAASAADTQGVITIVTKLTVKQKTSISSNVFDRALDALTQSRESDPATYTHMILTFLLAAGRFASPAAVYSALKPNAVPYQRQSA